MIQGARAQLRPLLMMIVVATVTKISVPTLTAFVLSTAHDAAVRTLETAHVVELTRQDQQRACPSTEGTGVRGKPRDGRVV